jgi:multisubunit Na+/H+ antiporter MnhF subunit
MDFLLFVLVNLVLFVRPAEVVPELGDVPFYWMAILSCTVAALSKLSVVVSKPELVSQPTTCCLLGMQSAVVLSPLSQGDTWSARVIGMDFLKIVLYFLLLVSILNTRERFWRFLFLLPYLLLGPTLLAVLHYHGVITLPGVQIPTRLELNAQTGELYELKQLYGTGIFSDPNDLSLIMTMGLVLCWWALHARRLGVLRWLGLPVAGLFGYALMLTHSRGGFLALLSCVLTFVVARFGWRRALPLGLLVVPAMFVVFGGRQTQISTGEGTAQERLRYWSEAFSLMRGSPLFGIGLFRLQDTIAHVAHNTFVQTFCELGFYGGSMFTGLFYSAFAALRWFGRAPLGMLDPEHARTRPYMMAMVVGYATGLFSISRELVLPTYLVVGLAAAYRRVANVPVTAPELQFGGAFLKRLFVVSVANLIFHYVFTRTFARWG